MTQNTTQTNINDFDVEAFDPETFSAAHSIMKHRMGDMIDGYLEDANTYMAHIKNGLIEHNKTQVAQYAHPLKSASAGLGVTSVSLMAQHIEEHAKNAIANDTQITHLNALVAPIEDALIHAKARFEQELKNTQS